MPSSGQFRAPEPVPEFDPDEPVSRYWVRFGQRELPIEAGETLIGRGDGCHIVVSEGLVSRRHARIVLDGGRPYIEDLGSANGTFVNQARLHGRALLFPGDHVFIGTCEIEVVRRADEERPTMPILEPYHASSHADEPASGVTVFEPRSEAPSSRSRSAAARLDTERPLPSDVAALEYAGRLADKMFTMGRVDAAQNLLQGPLEELLASARAGHQPSVEVVDAAGRYALKLANETLSGRWVDLAIELHLVVCRPLREETIQSLASLRAKAPLGTQSLLVRYHDRLRGNLASMGPSERVLYERVTCLVPGLDGDL
jgi:hypothetical protein